MERVTLLSPEARIDSQTLARLCLPRAPAATHGAAAPAEAEDQPLDEPARITQALRQTQGNVVQAARLLGLSRKALRYRMRRYGLARPQWRRSRGRGRQAVGTTVDRRGTGRRLGAEARGGAGDRGDVAGRRESDTLRGRRPRRAMNPGPCTPGGSTPCWRRCRGSGAWSSSGGRRCCWWRLASPTRSSSCRTGQCRPR